MSRGSNKKKRMQNEMKKYEKQRTQGLVMVVLGAVAAVAITAIKAYFEMQGAEAATTTWIDFGFYVFMIIMAGVVGIGARDAYNANKSIKDIESKIRR